MEKWSLSLNVKSSVNMCLAVVLVLVIFSQVILSGATVTVGTSSEWADEGSNNSVTCTPSEGIFFLRWYKSSTNEEFSDAQPILQLFVPTGAVTFDTSINNSHYSFDETATDYPLTVNGVGLNDEMRYWCEVELESGQPNEIEKTSFQVRRIPASIGLKHVDSNTSYADKDTADVIEGKNQFICSVPNIKPAAKFTWRLGSTGLDSSEERNETNEDSRLVNSFSTLTVDVLADSKLTCSAQNKQDGTTTPDQTISITLNTTRAEVPPTATTGPSTTAETPTIEIWVIIVIVVCVLIVIGIIIGVVCYCCNKNKSRDYGDHGSDTPMQ